MPRNTSSSRIETADQSTEDRSEPWQCLAMMERPEPSGKGTKLSTKQRHVLRQLPAPEIEPLIAEAPQLSDAGERLAIERIVDEMRLRFFFGGRAVAYVSTDKGPVVVSYSDSADNLDFSVSDLKAEGHQSVTIAFPEPLDISSIDDLPFFCTGSTLAAAGHEHS